ncbi:MAG: hypothetical protein U5K30_11060 [Acidimicrobiales bacterium]|nr:hypothetical protein [Acidimicrobiales bacterium]
MSDDTTEYDVQFHFDPVCPFAWMTSRWVAKVAAIRDYRVDWQFISLRLLNSHVDYDAHFPAEYEAGHNAGLHMLRVAAAVRERYGRDVVGDLYTAFGTSVFDVDPPEDKAAFQRELGSRDTVAATLKALDLDVSLADAVDEPTWDEVIQAETDAALEMTGKDVGTPIVQFNPPHGKAFFGPVISRVPDDDEAVRLWDLVTELAEFPTFAEIKRSLREPLQLRRFGHDPDAGSSGPEQDWHQGSRRLKK